MIQIETYTIDKSIFVAVIGILMKNRKIENQRTEVSKQTNLEI